MSEMAWHGTGTARSVSTPASTSTHSRTWGPDVWPADVRANVTSWPPRFRDRELIAALRADVATPQRIAVISNKDGVGKSTVAHLLRSIFADARGHEVALIAAKRDALVHLMTSSDPLTIIDIDARADKDLRNQLLSLCDQVVVVATPAPDGVYAADRCLDDLTAAGHTDLAANALCVLTRIRPREFSELLGIHRHFVKRCARVVRIGWDDAIARHSQITPDALKPTVRIAFFELAAALAARFDLSATNIAVIGKRS